MICCDLTLPSPAENLACDEALLDLREKQGGEEILRFWAPQRYFVVVGYGNAVNQEVQLEFCEAQGIPVLRRCTGGGTVLQGPGVLNYTLVLRAHSSSPAHSVAATNEFVLGKHRKVIAGLAGASVELQGHTDLAIGGLKCSGNAQRRKRDYLIFHGAFLLHLDVGMVEKTLRMPPKQPAYRAGRSHSDFLVNLAVQPETLKRELRKEWAATGSLARLPLEETSILAKEKYATHQWNFKF